MKGALDHFAVGGLSLKGRIIGESGAGIASGGCDCVDVLAGLCRVVVGFLDVGGCVVAGFGLVDDVGARDEAFGVGIGDESRTGGGVILVEAGVVGIERILLGVVKGHGVALHWRSTPWKRVIHDKEINKTNLFYLACDLPTPQIKDTPPLTKFIP